MVAAAGNSGASDASADTVLYPARYASVVAVAATDRYDVRPSWSSTGPGVELAAPGVSVYSTYLNGAYSYKSGTSMACPHVAGVAALVYASEMVSDIDFDGDGVWDLGEVRRRLTETARDLGASGVDNTYGYGLVDALSAVKSGGASPVPEPSVTDLAVIKVVESGPYMDVTDYLRDIVRKDLEARGIDLENP